MPIILLYTLLFHLTSHGMQLRLEFVTNKRAKIAENQQPVTTNNPSVITALIHNIQKYNLPAEISQKIGQMVLENNDLMSFLSNNVRLLPQNGQDTLEKDFFCIAEELINQDQFTLSSMIKEWHTLGTSELYRFSYQGVRFHLYPTNSKELFVTIKKEKTLQVWSKTLKTLLWESPISSKELIRNIYFSADSETMILATQDNIQFFKSKNGSILAEHKNNKNFESYIIGQFLINKLDKTITILWVPKDEDLSAILKVYSINNSNTLDEITTIQHNNINKVWCKTLKNPMNETKEDYIIIESRDFLFSVYHAQTGEARSILPDYNDDGDDNFNGDNFIKYRQINIDEENGKILISNWSNKGAFLWQMPNNEHPEGHGHFLEHKQPEEDRIDDCAEFFGVIFTPDFKGIIAINAFSSVIAWCAKTGKLLPIASNDRTTIEAFYVGSRGDYLITCEDGSGGPNSCNIYSLKSGQVVGKLPHPCEDNEYMSFVSPFHFQIDKNIYDLTQLENLSQEYKRFSIEQTLLLQSCYEVAKLQRLFKIRQSSMDFYEKLKSIDRSYFCAPDSVRELLPEEFKKVAIYIRNNGLLDKDYFLNPFNGKTIDKLVINLPTNHWMTRAYNDFSDPIKHFLMPFVRIH